MRPTSIDLCKRVVAARIEDGQSMGAIAERFKIPKGTVQNILERYRDSGGAAPKPQNAGRKPALSSEALRGAWSRKWKSNPAPRWPNYANGAACPCRWSLCITRSRSLGSNAQKNVTCGRTATSRCSRAPAKLADALAETEPARRHRAHGSGRSHGRSCCRKLHPRLPHPFLAS